MKSLTTQRLSLEGADWGFRICAGARSLGWIRLEDEALTLSLPAEYREEARRAVLDYAFCELEWSRLDGVTQEAWIPPLKPFAWSTREMLPGVQMTLRLMARQPARPEKGIAPCYVFQIRLPDGKCAGVLNLRVASTAALCRVGHVGYGVFPEFRGQGLAGRACQALRPLLEEHGFERLRITAAAENHASRRCCEKLGARLMRLSEGLAYYEWWL